MLTLLLNTLGFVLMAAVATHSIVLHVRLRRFRHALADVGEMLLTLDASVERMTEVSSGFSHRLQAELATVEGRVATAHRLGLELQAASRTAENVSAQLERLLRQHRQAEVSRASTTPRKRAEPKGFAERFGRADGATSGGHAKVPADAAAVARTEDELQVAAL